MTRILAAGATGRLGRLVVPLLRERHGAWVRILARDKERVTRAGIIADDAFVGNAAAPETLRDACTSVDTVFSCLGASVGLQKTPAKGSFREVDYQGNLNLLQAAKAAGVTRYVYVSAFSTPEFAHVAYIRAHEDFVRVLKESDLEETVIRPTGFFSSLAVELLPMARKGPMPLIGSGESRTNPIHDLDVATLCADAVFGSETEIAAGGPEVLTRRQITDLVFAAIGKPPRYRPLPASFLGPIRAAAGLYDRRFGDLVEFYGALSRFDAVAPTVGQRTLSAYLQEEAEKQ